MPSFYASTSKNLSASLSKELESLGLKVQKTDPMGCLFSGNWKEAVKANICSRMATRVSLLIRKFTAYNLDEIYHQTRKHDFTKYLSINQTFMVKSKVFESAITNQKMLALKVKDGIVDSFYKKFQARPSVDKKNPNVRIFIFGYKNKYHLSIDTSGGSLSRRGYRTQGGEAPLREHLAAALVNMTGWNRRLPLVDPMCGSGTLLIEAALMAKNRAPGWNRRFSFQNFSHIPGDLILSQVKESLKMNPIFEKKDLTLPPLYGFDSNPEVIKGARENAINAGVGKEIIFQTLPIEKLKALPLEKGLILTNPPYGLRLGREDVLKKLYKNLSFSLKSQFSGWSLWLLSGDPRWTAELGLKSSQKIPIDNGGIKSLWIHYPLRRGGTNILISS